MKKQISSKIDFLFDNNIKVTPLNAQIITNMFEILYAIEKNYNFKDDFRNGVMDLLVAATSLTENRRLITMDKELNRVLCNEFDLPFTKENDVLTIITDIKDDGSNYLHKKESKNYINRGWQFKMNKYGIM